MPQETRGRPKGGPPSTSSTLWTVRGPPLLHSGQRWPCDACAICMRPASIGAWPSAMYAVSSQNSCVVCSLHLMMKHIRSFVVFCVQTSPRKWCLLFDFTMWANEGPGFEISGCAEVAPLADDEPAYHSGPSGVRRSGRRRVLLLARKNLVSSLERGGEAMVCVQATRGSQTPPIDLFQDIHRVLEGTGAFWSVPDHKTGPWGSRF